MFCSKCGQKLDQEDIFCFKCGTKNKQLAPKRVEEVTKLPEKEVAESLEKEVAKSPEVEEVTEPSEVKKVAKPPAESLEDFLGTKFFAIVGSVSLMFAVGYFVKWSIDNGLLTPAGRIVIGIIASLMLIGVGEFLKKKYPSFFTFLSATGIAGLLIVTFLARNYEFEGLTEPLISGSVSFLAYIVEAGFGIFLSLRYNSRLIGNLSVFGGLISPLFVGAELDHVSLLTFLLVLSVVGFVVASRKKWPEITAMLFGGVFLYEMGLCFGRDNYLAKEDPVIFLLFVFVLHLLFGSGAIVRCIIDKTKQKAGQAGGQDVLDVSLFIFSLLIVNFIFANRVFDLQAWEHIGLLLIIEGFLLILLSWINKKFGLEIFYKFSLGLAGFFLVVGTAWEIGMENEFALVLALIFEGVALCYAGLKLKEGFFDFFGRFVLFINFFLVLGINNFGEKTLAVALLLAGLLYSIKSLKTGNDKSFQAVKNLKTGGNGSFWTVMAFLLMTGLIFQWSFGELEDELGKNLIFLIFVLPIIWQLFFVFLKDIPKSIGRAFSLIVLALINFVLWADVFGEFPKDEILTPLIASVLVITSGLMTLWGYLLQEKEKEERDFFVYKFAPAVILGFCSIAIIAFFDKHFSNFIFSLALIAWAFSLLVFGKSKQWMVFDVFGKIILVFAAMNFIGKEEIIQSTVLTIFLLGVFYYSVDYSLGKNSSKFTFWHLVTFASVSLAVLFWSFTNLESWLKDSNLRNFIFLSYILPLLWQLVLAGKLLKIPMKVSWVFALVFCFFLDSTYWTDLSGDNTNISAGVALALIVVGNLFHLFIQLKKIKEESEEATKKAELIKFIQVPSAAVALAFSTITVYVFGREFIEEPGRTVFWLTWGAALLAFGGIKAWPMFRYYGIGIIIFLVAKFYLVNILSWSTGEKVLALLPLGAALIFISFYYHKKKEKEKKEERNQKN